MAEIVVDTEEVVKCLEKIDKAYAELRAVLAPGVFKKESPRPQIPRSATDIMVLDLNVSQIPFKVKGGVAATDYDGFAFTFLKNRDGEIWQSSAELASAISQYGKVKIGQFVYQLSKDEVFIQRVIFKEGSR